MFDLKPVQYSKDFEEDWHPKKEDCTKGLSRFCSYHARPQNIDEQFLELAQKN